MRKRHAVRKMKAGPSEPAWSHCPGRRSRKRRRRCRARRGWQRYRPGTTDGSCRSSSIGRPSSLGPGRRPFACCRAHRISAAVVVDGRRRVRRVDLVRAVCNQERIEIVQAARGVFWGDVLDAAIGLLPRFEKPGLSVSGVGIVGKIRALQGERTVGKVGVIRDPVIEIREGSEPERVVLPRSTGGPQAKISGFQRRLEGCQKRGWRRRGGKGGGPVAKPMIEASGLGEKFRVGGGRVW